MSEPFFSILTPSFEYGRFLWDAIESVRRQDVDVEHVVVDAGSTDSTLNVLRSSSDVRWVSEPDRGQSHALNKALAMSTGQYVGWLNADEFYLEGALAAVQGAITSGDVGEVDVIHADCVFVDEAGRFLRLRSGHRHDRIALRHYGCVQSSCATFFRRSALPEDPFDERFRMLMDWDLYLTLDDRRRSFAYLRRDVGAFRIHGAQVTAAPVSPSSSEHVAVRQKHRIRAQGLGWSAARMAGRAAHVADRVVGRAYLREFWAARKRRGTDMRWFARPIGSKA